MLTAARCSARDAAGRAFELHRLSHQALRTKAVGHHVLHHVQVLNLRFFKVVYCDLLNTKKTRPAVEAALAAIDEYLRKRAATIFAPIIEHLTEVGEARSATEIEDHFQRNFDVSEVTTACEYLADQGVIGKASTSTRLTKRSNVDVQELAFFSLDPR